MSITSKYVVCMRVDLKTGASITKHIKILHHCEDGKFNVPR